MVLHKKYNRKIHFLSLFHHSLLTFTCNCLLHPLPLSPPLPLSLSLSLPPLSLSLSPPPLSLPLSLSLPSSLKRSDLLSVSNSTTLRAFTTGNSTLYYALNVNGTSGHATGWLALNLLRTVSLVLSWIILAWVQSTDRLKGTDTCTCIV